MINRDYISYIKELILHHCLRCGILSETTTCDICRREINGEPVMIKVEVRITASDIEAHVADLFGDFGELIHPKNIRLSKRFTRGLGGSLVNTHDKIELGR